MYQFQVPKEQKASAVQSALDQNKTVKKQEISHKQTDAVLLLVRYNQDFLETVAVGRDKWHFNVVLFVFVYFCKPYI